MFSLRGQIASISAELTALSTTSLSPPNLGGDGASASGVVWDYATASLPADATHSALQAGGKLATAYPTLPPRATETSLHYAAERAK